MTKRRNRRTKGFYTDDKGRRRPITSKSLYWNGAMYRERKKFEREYGKKRGDYVYGATVEKVKREKEARKGNSIRYFPKRGFETGKSKAMTAAEIKRKAVRIALDGKPIKLIAMKRRPDGLFDNYVQSFNNWEAANRAATTLRNEGYHVGIAT
jgi:hypothetical protein